MNSVGKILALRLNGDIGLSAAIHEKSLMKKTLQLVRMAFMVLLLILFAAVSYNIGLFLVRMGVGEAIPTLCYMLITLFSVIYTIIRINDTITGETDNQYILSLPLGTFTPTIVMFLRLYIQILLVTFLMAIPMILPLGVSKSFMMRYVIGLLFAPLPASGVAALVGMVIVVLLSTSRHHNLINSIISLVLITSLISFGIYITVNIASILTGFSQIDASAESIIAFLGANYKFAAFFQGGIVEGHGGWIFGYIGVSCIWYTFFLFMLSMMYPELMSALKCPMAYKEYEIRDLRTKTPYKALLKREIQCILGSRRYFVTSMMVNIVAIIIPLAIIIVGLDRFMLILRLDDFREEINSILPWFRCMLAAAGCMTYCSYTIEGKRGWISLTAPIDDMDIRKAKAYASFVFTIPTFIISGLLYVFAGFEGPWFNITPALYLILITYLSLWIDSKLADYTIESESGAMHGSISFIVAYIPSIIIPLLIIISTLYF